MKTLVDNIRFTSLLVLMVLLVMLAWDLKIEETPKFNFTYLFWIIIDLLVLIASIVVYSILDKKELKTWEEEQEAKMKRCEETLKVKQKVGYCTREGYCNFRNKEGHCFYVKGDCHHMMSISEFNDKKALIKDNMLKARETFESHG